MNRFIALMSLMVGGTLPFGFSFDEEKAKSSETIARTAPIISVYLNQLLIN